MSSQKPQVAIVKDSVEFLGVVEEEARVRRLASMERETRERILIRFLEEEIGLRGLGRWRWGDFF